VNIIGLIIYVVVAGLLYVALDATPLPDWVAVVSAVLVVIAGLLNRGELPGRGAV
jgi:hypothetical protein